MSYLTTTCSPGEKPSEVIILNDSNLEGIRAATGLKIYAVTWPASTDDLTLTPCASSALADQISRWIKDEGDAVCTNSMNLQEQSTRVFQDIIDQRGYNRVNQNDNIVDAVKKWRACHSDDEGKSLLGKVQARDGTCWEHTHAMDMSVVDVSSVAGIDNYVAAGSSVITLSAADVDMINNIAALHSSLIIGRYGDHINLAENVPSPLNDLDIQATFKTVEFNPSARYVLYTMVDVLVYLL